MNDETQDNNPTQYELCMMLASPEFNLFVVGDDDQSMYGFRGAEPQLFIDFVHTLKGAIQINLEKNYRSQPDILIKANMLIANNKNRIVKQLIPHKTGEDKALYYSHFMDETEEAIALVDELKVIKETKLTPKQQAFEYKDFVVIYRTNAQCKEVEDALITQGIPYIIHGGFSFYERKEVKDVMAYLRLVLNTDNNEAFTRVCNTPSRYIGKAYLDKLKAVKGASLWKATDKVNLTPTEKTGTNSFKTLVNSMKQLHESGFPIPDLIKHLLENGYGDHLKNQNEAEDADEIDNPIVTKLISFAGRFSTLESLIEYVDLMTSKRKDSINGVQLMTIHRSKGLEFPVVFGIGINEKLLPHYKAIEDEECGDDSGIEEERRLAYVLVTRGEMEVHLSSTMMFNGKVCGASRFIEEMGLVADNIKDDETEENDEEETA
jgi:DNA helicase-2/ATP-dependent DNA helicase PcrA